MRVLVSAVGTRGDVQPVLALALALRAHGHEPRLAVPPNFTAWAADLGFQATPVGVEMRAPARSAGSPTAHSPAPPPRPEDMIRDLVADQFAQLALAAPGCDVIVGAGAHQFAARSIAERVGAAYVNAVYAHVHPLARPAAGAQRARSGCRATARTTPGAGRPTRGRGTSVSSAA